MCFLLYIVVVGTTSRPNVKAAVKAPDARASDPYGMFVDSLLYCYGTFGFGFLGSSVTIRGTLLPNALFFLLSCAYRHDGI